MNAFANSALFLCSPAKNFTQWCEQAWQHQQIEVRGTEEEPYLVIRDEVLDAAFAWMIEGHQLSAGKHPEFSVMADFIITDILGEGQADHRVKLMYDVLTGKADVKMLTRCFVYAHIEEYQKGGLVGLQFNRRNYA